jgi:pimeloyl-ACP methyl ester carboxylesterase
VRRHPRLVSKLILSTTTAPNPELIKRYQQELAMIQDVPDDIVREGAKIRFYDIVNPPEDEAKFWKAYLDELFSVRLDKKDILSTYACLLDYVTNYHFEPQDLDNWHGEILILDSDDDNVFDSSSRQTVNDLYPQAHTHTFSNAGHSPASTQRDLYFEIVRKFLHE